ncbi:LysR substrate-binding domain-containing protein [Marinomonas sp.]
MKNEILDRTQDDPSFDKIDLRKLPPLKSLKGFEAAARLQSVRGAAEELSLTHPAISHQIQTLENSLACKLFEREGRHIRLTPAGERYYPFVRKALETLIVGTEEVRSQISQPTLRVQTYITTSIRWLAPRLPKFKKRHPDVNLEISTYNADWEFDEKHADVAIIYKTQALPDYLHWQPLFTSTVFPVCSPELLATLTNHPEAKELQHSPLISVYTEEKYWSWKDWFESAGVQITEPTGPEIIEVDTLAAALEMAVIGEGIALVNGPFADRDLATGRLVVPVDHQVEDAGEWGIVCHKNMFNDNQVQAFIQWLQEQS